MHLVSSFPLLPLPPRTTLFPYTTLFRSVRFDERLPDVLLAHGEPNHVGLRRAGGAGPVGGRGDWAAGRAGAESQSAGARSEEHTSELQSPYDLVCRLLLEKKKNTRNTNY